MFVIIINSRELFTAHLCELLKSDKCPEVHVIEHH
jgi:hypothetical protein